jgi:hypothetical protein
MMNILLKLICTMLTIPFISGAYPATAQNSFDSVDKRSDDRSGSDAIHLDPDSLDQIETQFTEQDALPVQLEQSSESEEAKSNIVNRCWQKLRAFGDSRLTFDYKYAYQSGDPQRTVMNRASMRLEWGRLFAKRYYLRFDGKTTAMAFDDHLLRADDDAYRITSSLREGYIEAGFNHATLKVGKQILIWGEADTAIVTDVVSPRDLSELAFKSLEDSRVGQTMVTLDLYGAYGTMSAFVNPDPGIDELPEPGTEYYVAVPMPDVTQLNEDKPDADDAEYGLRWKRTIRQSDIAIMAADLVTNQPVLRYQGLTASGGKRLIKEYQRYKMAGFAGNLSIGNFIWKAELAYAWNRPFQREDQNSGWAAVDKDTLDIALGMEFSPASRLWTFTLEAANKHVLQWDDNLLNQQQNETAVTGIISRSLLNETLSIEYTILMQLQSKDTFQKLRTDYEITDNMTGSIELGGFTSQDEQGPYWEFRNKERIMAALKFIF